jgi:uncharacterized membrane protein
MKKHIDILAIAVSLISGIILSSYRPGGILGFVFYAVVFFVIVGLFKLVTRRFK